ncbi:MAG: DUF4281 domain-containing protein [Anaerolineaceae bacterium]|nr:DUF4281 domain-containing protein [Anaerolineaceae bacterium]
MDLLYNLSNLLVLPFWLLMIFAPHWQVTKSTLRSLWVILPPALLYTALILPVLPALMALLANPSLASIASGLGTPLGATTVWAHLVTFDLFAGRWAYLDSRERRVSAWLASPALLVILMFGPFGLLLYLLLRHAYRRDR